MSTNAAGATAPPVTAELKGNEGATRRRPRVEAHGVSHWFASEPGGGLPTNDASKVLDNVSLEVGDGEFVSLIGPSGCGKTTLLNAIAGFVLPTVGQVAVDGEQVHGVQKERVSFMFARDTLMPWRSALANVMLPMECGTAREGKSRADRKDRAHDLLSRVGLGDAGHKFPHQLSHGMRQRVALARTLACESDIILMDEPFGALDAQTRVLVQSEFAQIREEFKRTVLMVTHDLTEAIALSDRIVVMSKRPARIKAVYDVELPRPRNVLDLPKEQAFHDLYSQLWEDLREELPNA